MPRYIMPDANEADFRALDPFTRGYIEALFWTNEEPGTVREPGDDFERKWHPELDHALPGDVGFLDFAPEALEKIKRDCAQFQDKCKRILACAEEQGRNLESLGHDFWLTRNGHGTGFWDRKELEYVPPIKGNTVSIGTALTNAAKRFGEVDVYLGDDQKVWL